VIVQCLRIDSSCFGHYYRSCLLNLSPEFFQNPTPLTFSFFRD